jgi:hypothetical protein
MDSGNSWTCCRVSSMHACSLLLPAAITQGTLLRTAIHGFPVVLPSYAV